MPVALYRKRYLENDKSTLPCPLPDSCEPAEPGTSENRDHAHCFPLAGCDTRIDRAAHGSTEKRAYGTPSVYV